VTEILLDKGTGLSRTANQDKVALRSSSTTPGAALVEDVSLTTTTTTDISNGTGILIPNLTKTFQSVVTGTGAVAANVSIQCSTDGTTYYESFSFALSGTTSDHAEFTFQSKIPYWKAVTTGVTGTGAACVTKVMV